MPPELVVLEIVQSAIGALLVLALGYPLVRVLVRRTDRRIPDPSHFEEISRRLGQLETIADATAVEVERISEGQRFVSRLLAGQSSSRAEARGRAGSGQNGS